MKTYECRPNKYEDMCLCTVDGLKKDDKGKVIYKKFTKPKLPNHKQWNPAKEDQRKDYYYSSVPFRDESQLLLSDEAAEQTFQRLTSERGSATMTSFRG